MGKNIFSLLILMIEVSVSYSCFSQQEETLNDVRDSAYRFQGIIPPVEFQYNFDAMFSKSFTTDFSNEVLLDTNPSTIWLRTELLISNQSEYYGSNEINTHFTSPLYQQYLKDSEFNMVRYVLGLAQTSAVAYMAYMHVKKYGFWK